MRNLRQPNEKVFSVIKSDKQDDILNNSCNYCCNFNNDLRRLTTTTTTTFLFFNPYLDIHKIRHTVVEVVSIQAPAYQLQTTQSVILTRDLNEPHYEKPWYLHCQYDTLNLSNARDIDKWSQLSLLLEAPVNNGYQKTRGLGPNGHVFLHTCIKSIKYLFLFSKKLCLVPWCWIGSDLQRFAWIPWPDQEASVLANSTAVKTTSCPSTVRHGDIALCSCSCCNNTIIINTIIIIIILHHFTIIINIIAIITIIKTFQNESKWSHLKQVWWLRQQRGLLSLKRRSIRKVTCIKTFFSFNDTAKLPQTWP